MTFANDDEDAAVVIAVLTALAAAPEESPVTPPRSVWGERRTSGWPVGPHAWWSSGLTRP